MSQPASLLGLGLGPEDVRVEDLLKLGCRRLAQLDVQLGRIADTAELLLKLHAINANMTLSALREAEEDQQAAPAGKAPSELLQQSPEELAELEETYQRAVTRFGKGDVPVGLDLYAELEKARPDNTEEEP